VDEEQDEDRTLVGYERRDRKQQSHNRHELPLAGQYEGNVTGPSEGRG
jgi:hypothetical protein